jgi:hypothetical protein
MICKPRDIYVGHAIGQMFIGHLFHEGLRLIDVPTLRRVASHPFDGKIQEAGPWTPLRAAQDESMDGARRIPDETRILG